MFVVKPSAIESAMDGGACSTVRIALRTCLAGYVTSDVAVLVDK